MSETLRSITDGVLTRLFSFWVKPDVLPSDPTVLIKADVPLIYVLESFGITDRIALNIVAKRLCLPAPSTTLQFGDISEPSSIDVLKKNHRALLRSQPASTPGRLARLMQASIASAESELQIVPVAVYWGRAPDKEQSIFKLLFLENWQITSGMRRLLTTLIHGRNTLLSISEPLMLQSLKSAGQATGKSTGCSNDDAELLTRKLGRILRVHFRQRRIASLGPDQSHRRMLIDHVLSDSTVRHAIDAAAGKSSLEKEQRRAREYAYEIAADMSYSTVRILHTLLRKLWNELYDGVELHGVNRLKAVVDGNEIVYVPCHRSHIDYLLLSYILYTQGLSLPHIAAGINLNLPFVGGLLRTGGAFFLRRSFSGKPLYAAVFNAYLKELLQRGHALEYFVEGGRSRSGRLLPPKSGMLAMTVQAYLSQPKTPVVFVPVYFGYERLLEGRAFTSELAGGKKQRESIFALIKSLRTLREDYGRVHVSFGDPIALDALMTRHEPQWRSIPVSEERPTWVKPVINELGVTIMRRINETASVTPISLLAATLLATPQGCISSEELKQQIDIYQRLLSGAYANTLVSIPEVDGDELIAHGMRLGFVKTSADDIGTTVELKPGQSTPLTYFRNNILHLLTLPALIAATFTNCRDQSEKQIKHLVSITLPVIQGELFLTTEVDDELILQTINGLVSAGLITRHGERWARAAAGSLEAVALTRLANVVVPALERDYLCACLLAHLTDGQISAAKLSKYCELAAQRLAKTEGLQATELYDKHLHHAFIDAIHQHGYLERDGELLRPRPSLFHLQEEARSLLVESKRHAIIAVSRTTMASQRTS